MIVFDGATRTRTKIGYFVGRSLPFFAYLGGMLLALVFGSK